MRSRPLLPVCTAYMACLILILQIIPSLGERLFGYHEAQMEAQSWMEQSRGLFVRVSRIDSQEDSLILRARLLSPEGMETGWYIRILVYGSEDQTKFREGDILKVSGRLKLPEKPVNPGQWDEETFLKSQEFLATLTSSDILLLQEHHWWNPAPLIGGIRRFLSDTIDSLFREPFRSIYKAMLLGEKSSLSTEIKDLFSRAGISHIAAISGLHLTILIGSLERWLSGKMGHRRAFPLLMLMLWLYVWLTGFSIATVRAALMFSYQTAARLLDRDPDDKTALFLAAMIQLLLKPLSVLGAAFWLTYGAVAGIWAGRSFALQLFFLPRSLREKIAGGLGVSLVTLPVSLWFFSGASVGSFFLNLLVVPLVRYILILGVASVALGSVLPWAGQLLARLGSAVLNFTLWVSSKSTELPWLTFQGKPAVLQMAAFFGIVGFLLWAWKSPKQRRLPLYLISLALSLALIFYPASRRVIFLSVGQGDCSIIEWDGTVILVDAGPSCSTVIKPYLESRGIRRIDAAILSHPDMDHMEGLLTLSESGFPIDLLLESSAASNDTKERRRLEESVVNHGGSVVRAGRGDELVLEKGGTDIRILCLSPGSEQGTVNEDSLVTLIRLSHLQLLYMGDAGTQTEQQLELDEIDHQIPLILKAGHQGSMYSSSEWLLDRAEPDLTVISCGENNSYGHPHKAMLERLEERNYPYQVTAWNGAVWIDQFLGHEIYWHMFEDHS